MDDAEYEKHAKNVQSYVPFLENIIMQLKSPKMKNREQQLVKMESLYEMITDKRKKLKLETLIKCEDVIVKLYQKVKGEKGEVMLFNNPKLTDTDERKDREKSNKPDIYSVAAQTISKPSELHQKDVTTPSSTSSPSSNEQPPKSFFLRKPPISYADLEILEKDVASELENKLSLNELNNLRNSLCEQLDIDTTVRNKVALSRVVTTPPSVCSNVKKKDFLKQTVSSTAPKILRESEELFGNAFQELDKKYAGTSSSKKHDVNYKRTTTDEDNKMALHLAEKARELRNKKDKEKDRRDSKDSRHRDKDKKDRDKERKSSKDRDKRGKEHNKNRDKDKQNDIKDKDNKDTAREKDKVIEKDDIRKESKEKISIEKDKEKTLDKEKDTNKHKDTKDRERNSKERDQVVQEVRTKKVEEVKPTIASRDPRLKFGANVAVVSPRQTTPLTDRLAFKYNPKPRRDVVGDATSNATAQMQQPQTPKNDFFSPASPDDESDKGATVTNLLLKDPKVTDALATLKNFTAPPRVYVDDSTPPVLDYHGGGAVSMGVAAQNLNPPLLSPYEERPASAAVPANFQGVALNYAQSPRYVEDDFYGRRFNVVQQQQQRFVQQQQQQQQNIYFPQQQQQLQQQQLQQQLQQQQFGTLQNFDYFQRQQQQKNFYQQQQQQQQPQQKYFAGNRDPRIQNRAPFYQAPPSQQTPFYQPPTPAPAPRMTYKEYKEQRERELHLQQQQQQRDRDNDAASGGDKGRSRRDGERREVEHRDADRRSRSRERYRSSSRYRYVKGESRDRERRDASSHVTKESQQTETTDVSSPLDSLYAGKSAYKSQSTKGYGANFKIPKKNINENECKDIKTRVKMEIIETKEEDKTTVIKNEVIERVEKEQKNQKADQKNQNQKAEQKNQNQKTEQKNENQKTEPKTETVEAVVADNKPREEEESILSKFFQNLIKTTDEELKKRTLVSLIESVPGFSEEQKKKISSIILPKEEEQQQQQEENVVTPTEEGTKKEEHQEEEKKEEVKEKKKLKTELDRLHEDIREMFIRDGVVTATGRRMCRLINAAPKKTAPKNDVEIKQLSVVLPKVSLNKIKEEEDERRYSLRKTALKLSYNEDETAAAAVRKTTPEKPTVAVPEKAPTPTTTTPTTPSSKQATAKKKKNAWATGIIRKKKRRKSPETSKAKPEVEDLDAVHDRNYYTRDSLTCKLCPTTSRWIAAHYRSNHPTVEVLSSRPPPDVVADAIRDSLEHDEYKDETGQDDDGGVATQREAFACLFCDYSLATSAKYFYDHVTIHTGEYRHKCSLCDYGRSNSRSIQSHLVDAHKIDGGAARRKIVTIEAPTFTNLYGYLCGICNYTQLSHNNLLRHVQCHKNSDETDRRIYKVRLNKSVDTTPADNQSQDVDVEKEVEEAVEEPSLDLKDDDWDAGGVEIKRSTRSRRRKSVVVSDTPSPTSKQSKIDVAVFTSNTDLIEENKKIEAERLKTMQSINETLLSKQQRNSLDIVEKLREKLQEDNDEDIASKFHDNDDDAEILVVDDKPPVNLPMYEKIQQKTTHLDTNSTVAAYEKPNRIISDVIEKLQGKLGAGAEVYDDDDDESDEERSTTPPLPPLVHVSDVMPDPLIDRGSLNVGAVEILKNGDEYVYTCRASPCVYATRLFEAFETHCALIEHAWNKTLTQYERCGECGAQFPTNCDRLPHEALTHARQQHAEFFGVKYGTIGISSNLFAASPQPESNNNSETDPETPQQNDEIADDNPFTFKIVDVVSLAEVDGVENAFESTAPTPPTMTSSNNEAASSATKTDVQKKPQERKSEKALKVFLECYADLFKCSEYDCSFTTNKRKMFDIHMTMHGSQHAKFVACIYCEKYFTFENLGAHYEKMHGRCKYQCTYCLYRCLVAEFMEIHQALEHPDLPYQMILLPKREEEKNLTSIFKEYAKSSLRPVLYLCSDAEFLYADTFLQHVSTCKKNPYLMCYHRKGPKVCMKVHQDTAALLEHWNVVHDIHPYKCAYCDIGRRDVNDLMIHQAMSHPALPPDIEDRTTAPHPDVKNSGLSSKATLDFEKLIAELRRDPTKFAEATRLLITYTPPTFVAPAPIATTTPSITTATTTKSVTTYSKVNPSINVVVETTPATNTKTRPKIRVLPTSILKLAPETNTSPVTLEALEDEPLVTIETSNDDVDVDAVDPLSLDVPVVPTPTTGDTTNVSINTTTTTTSNISMLTNGEKSGLKGHQLYRCAKCMLAFADHVKFKEHLVKSGDFCKSGDTAYKPYKCAHCGKYVKSQANLLDHLMYHGVVRFACSLCDCKFPHGLQARHHMKTKHNVFSVVMQPTAPGRANLAKDEFIVKPQSSAVPKSLVSSPSSTTTAAKDDADVENHQMPPDDATTTKTVFFSHETDEIPQKSILSYDITCGHCKTFKNKVRSNIVRHLMLHQNDKDFQVADIAPVNPVPCLEKNEKMFDKMYNLASSSHAGGRMGGVTKNDAKLDKTRRQDGEKNVDDYPAFVPSTKRFQCCAVDCNYLCLEEGNLRHHLTALHQEELTFVCVHCKRDLSDAPDVDAILKHLKLHELHLYKCSQCDFLHNLRHKVVRHVEERHPKSKDVTVVVIRAMDSEPYEEKHHHHHQHPQIVTSDVVKASSSKRWRCSMCKYRSDAKWQTDQHVKNKHDVECRFKCSWCSYKSDVETSFGEHFAVRHPGREVDVIAAYYEETEIQNVSLNDPTNLSDGTDDAVVADFDTTPLWLRDKPRVRHIRGILLDENTSSTPTSTTKKITSPASSSSSPKKRKRSVDVRAKIDEESEPEERRRDAKIPKIRDDVEVVMDEAEVIVVDEDEVDKSQQRQQQQRKKQSNGTMQELDEIDLLCIYGDFGMPEENSFKCPKCDALRTTNVGDFVRHVAKEIAYERYICELCGLRSITLDEASTHRSTRHIDVDASTIGIKPLRIDKTKRRWLTLLVRRQQAIITGLGFKLDEEFGLKDFDEYFREKPAPKAPVEETIVIDEQLSQQQQQEKLFTKDKYRCDRCSAIFDSVPEFEFHAKEKHGDWTHDVKFTVQAEDLTPLMLVNVENTRNAMRCSYCTHTSSSKIQLEAHASQRHPGLPFHAYRFRCAICDGKAETTKILRTHYRKLHPDHNELRYYDLSGKLIKTAGLIKLKIYRCPQCSYVGHSHNANNIRMHLRLHAKPFICLLCEAEFKTRPDARAHHTREHPHNTETIQERPEKFAKIQEIMTEILKNVQEVEEEDDVEEIKQPPAPQPETPTVGVGKKKQTYFARKSTSTLAPARDVASDTTPRNDDVTVTKKWSRYGQKPEPVDLSKITTTFEISDARMKMSCEQLARIYNLCPKVVVKKL